MIKCWTKDTFSELLTCIRLMSKRPAAAALLHPGFARGGRFWQCTNCAILVVNAYSYLSKRNLSMEKKVQHTAWIGIWITKRPGATSDNGFILEKKNKKLTIKDQKRSYGRFWIYQLISTANPAFLRGLGLDWLCWLAGRSKTAHRICFSLLYFNLI